MADIEGFLEGFLKQQISPQGALGGAISDIEGRRKNKLELALLSKKLEMQALTPQTSELGSITTTISHGGSIDSFQPILTSLLFTIIILYLSISIFRKKDY